MIKIFSGNDSINIRNAALKEVASLEKQGGRVQFVDCDNYEAGMVASLASENSLFGGEMTYLLENPLSNSKVRDELEANSDTLRDSNNVFIFIEGALKADEKKYWNKYADVEEFKSVAGRSFNTFALADALANRDRKSLWLLWSEARLSGIPSEELIGILWWQFKSIRLAALTDSAEEAGMKDYPYQKSKRALTRFTKEEVEKLSHSLLDTYHQSRLGGLDMDLAVERWLLKV